jgi:integrase
MFVGSADDASLFTGPKGGPVRRAFLYREWTKAVSGLGLPPTLHVHDLRHTAGTLAAHTGATTRELMARLGHSSQAAALRYQHAAERRHAEIAAALDGVLANPVSPKVHHNVRDIRPLAGRSSLSKVNEV